MNLTDAPNINGFETGIRIWNSSEKPVDCTLIVIGNGLRKDVSLNLPAMNNVAFMLSQHVPQGVYGVALLGPVSGVVQYSQDGNYYDAAQIAKWE